MNNIERRLRVAAGAVLTALALVALTSCVFRTLREQQQQIDELCLLSGTIAGDAARPAPLVVVLLQQASHASEGQGWRLTDHFVSERGGGWMLAATPGNYALAAFEDRSRDLVYQPGEPVLNVTDDHRVECAAGAKISGLALQIPADGGHPFERDADVTKLQARHTDDQLTVSLAAVTAVGTVTSLADPRFSAENVKAGMWTPYDFLIDAGPGVYFLQDYDATKTPVLFVHGIDGSPDNFRYLIEHMDGQRFQPWVYYYPSGARLGHVADHLAQTVQQIEVRYRVSHLIVVAHSMGGLVSRGFLLRYRQNGGSAQVPIFITLSTPWGGHNAAEMGVELAPTVVRSWYDMAPGSDYLTSLFYGSASLRQRLPAATPHHLLFSFKKSGASFGESGDEVVTVASQLRREAQQEVRGIYGFDDTHTGILEDPAVSELVNRLLEETK